MPKYQICCSATTYYYVVVEAPTQEAAEAWYDNHPDESKFTTSGDSYENWEYVETQEADDIYSADVTVDADGNPIKETP